MSVGGVTVAAVPLASQSSLHHHHHHHQHHLHHHHINNNNKNNNTHQQQQHPLRAHRGYCPEMFPGTRWDEPKGDGAEEVGETLAGDAGVVRAALQVNGDHDLDPRLDSNRAAFSQRPSWFHVGPESQPPTSTPLSINVNIVLAEPSPLNGGLKLEATDDDCAAAAASDLLLPHINVFRPGSTPAQGPVPRKPPPPYPGTAAPVSLPTGGDGRFHGNALTMATRLTINYGDQEQLQQQQQQQPPPYVPLPSGHFLPLTPPRSQPHSPEVDGDVLASLGLQHQLQNHHHHQQHQQKPMGHHHPHHHHQQQQHRQQHQNQQQDQLCIEIVQHCHAPVKFSPQLYTSGPHNHHHHQQQHQLQDHQQQQVQQHPEAELQLHHQQQQQLLQHCLNSPSLAQSQQSQNHHHHEHDLYQRDVSADDADHNNVAQQHHCLHSNDEQQQHQRESVYNQQHHHQQESVQQHQKQQHQSVHHHNHQQQESLNHHQQQQESVNHQQQQYQKQQQQSIHHQQQQQQESVKDQPQRHQQESLHHHHQHQQHHQQHHQHQQVTPRLPGAPRSGRRTNPELEKRRIHHCLFPGWIPCRGLLQGVHQKFSPESSPEDAHRREAVRVRVGRLHVEVRALRRAHATLPQAHRLAALPVPRVRPGLLSLRPPGAAQQETPVSSTPPTPSPRFPLSSQG
uniref:Mediator of RNA polymerase II transcription subunit 15-like isoform X1 n=1 Tax=Petromyzon marinus TaxID=7757 RepID=A0AAJ7T858_PETMA|nr:mediator of RNA polymerase II transcription subunit 15-like isoform X1 [Petromyzon marinus]